MRLGVRRCPACRSDLVGESRWWGLVKRMGPTCPGCGARVAYDTAGGVYLIVGKVSTEDPAEAARIAEEQGIPWPPRPDGSSSEGE